MVIDETTTQKRFLQRSDTDCILATEPKRGEAVGLPCPARAFCFLPARLPKIFHSVEIETTNEEYTWHWTPSKTASSKLYSCAATTQWLEVSMYITPRTYTWRVVKLIAAR